MAHSMLDIAYHLLTGGVAMRSWEPIISIAWTRTQTPTREEVDRPRVSGNAENHIGFLLGCISREASDRTSVLHIYRNSAQNLLRGDLCRNRK